MKKSKGGYSMSCFKKVCGISLLVMLTIAVSYGSAQKSSPNSGKNEVNPANNATNVCVDTLLKITFDSVPTLGTAGLIKICKAADDTVVDMINLADPIINFAVTPLPAFGAVNTTHLNVIGNNTEQVRIVNYDPVFIQENSAIIVPHNNKLSYGTAYYVTIEKGVLNGKISGSVFSGIRAKKAWRFTTKPVAPAGTTLMVNGNGQADFCTIQGAIDNIPGGNTAPYTINIAAGNYPELLYIKNKSNLTIKGQGSAKTIIQYDNCDSFNAGTGGGTNAPLTAATVLGKGGRSIMLVNGSTGLVLDGLTIQSTHAQNSAANNQAETVYFNGSPQDQYIAKNCNFISCQDTIQSKSKAWFYNCLVAGDVDFIWGSTVTVLFENCEIRSRYNPNGNYIVQARAAAGDKGFVFLNCKLTNEGNPADATFLARSSQTSAKGSITPNTNYDNVAYINCKMDTHIKTVGWQFFGGVLTGTTLQPPGPNPAIATVTNGWKEYKSMNLNGTAVLDVSSRITPGSYQLTDADVAVNYANRKTIFGGWDPIP